ncbi:hypothetical protein ACIRNI_27505 [Streptomyces sp. NPDC093546]|uniref:hypothetical protein n=1 Tax=Streptomyces sp. NPDC093546 TaxID=3366040 RepID=UPI00382D35D5
MRRIATVCVTLAAAAALAVSGATAAFGAQGTLYVDRTALPNPSGCYDFEAIEPLVHNLTNDVVIVYELPGCRGEVEEIVEADDWEEDVDGMSLFVR